MTPKQKSITVNGIKTIDVISSAILAIILVLGSVHLYDTKGLSELTLLGLFTLSGLASFILLFNRRLKKASTQGFELYEEMKEVETSMKDIASAVLELAESNESGYKQPDWDCDRYEKAKAEIRKLID